MHLHGLVKVVTSDQQSNRRPLLLSRIILPELVEGSERFQTLRVAAQNAESPIPPPSHPWLCIDMGVYMHITHYSLRVPIDASAWPSLQHWQLQVKSVGVFGLGLADYLGVFLYLPRVKAPYSIGQCS